MRGFWRLEKGIEGRNGRRDAIGEEDQKGIFFRVLAPILGFGLLSVINPRKKERKKDRVVRRILVV